MPTLEVSLAPDYKGIVKDAVKQKGEAWIKESFPVKAGWWIAKEAVVHGIEKGVEMGVEKLAGVAVGESALPASLTFNAAEIVGDLRVENANLEDEIADFDIKKAGDVKTKIEAAAIGFGVAYEAGLGGKGAQGAPDLYKRGKERRAKLIQEILKKYPKANHKEYEERVNQWVAKNLPEIKAKKHNDFVKIAKTSVWDKYWRGHKSDHDDKLHWDAWWAIMGTNTSGWTKSPPMKPGLKEEWDKAMKGAKKG